MWVKNVLQTPQTLNKSEKIVVLKPGCIADVDLPKDANLKKMGLEVVNFDKPKDLVGGQPAEISEPDTGDESESAGGKNGKKGRRNEDR